MPKPKILIIALVGLLVVGYGGYSFAKPKPKVVPPKVNGTPYILPKAFTFNLKGSHYATLQAALVLAPGQEATAASGGEAATPPEGYGTLPEESVVRAIITNDFTDQTAQTVVSPEGRAAIRKQILKDIATKTDVKVDDILFTDVAVQ